MSSSSNMTPTPWLHTEHIPHINELRGIKRKRQSCQDNIPPSKKIRLDIEDPIIQHPAELTSTQAEQKPQSQTLNRSEEDPPAANNTPKRKKKRKRGRKRRKTEESSPKISEKLTKDDKEKPLDVPDRISENSISNEGSPSAQLSNHSQPLSSNVCEKELMKSYPASYSQFHEDLLGLSKPQHPQLTSTPVVSESQPETFQTSAEVPPTVENTSVKRRIKKSLESLQETTEKLMNYYTERLLRGSRRISENSNNITRKDMQKKLAPSAHLSILNHLCPGNIRKMKESYSASVFSEDPSYHRTSGWIEDTIHRPPLYSTPAVNRSHPRTVNHAEITQTKTHKPNPVRRLDFHPLSRGDGKTSREKKHTYNRKPSIAKNPAGHCSIRDFIKNERNKYKETSESNQSAVESPLDRTPERNVRLDGKDGLKAKKNVNDYVNIKLKIPRVNISDRDLNMSISMDIQMHSPNVLHLKQENT